MERKGVVGASERNPWRKRDEPLDDFVYVYAHYESGVDFITCKINGVFISEDSFGPVLFWMPIPPLPD